MFPYEPSGFAEMLRQRKESARKTLRQTSCEELRALVRELFPDGSHPWAEPMSQFIEEHQAETAVRGETSDRIAFVYSTHNPIAASGMKAPVKTWASVYLVQTSSRCWLKSFRKPDTSDGRRRRSLQLRNALYAKKN